MSVSGFRTTTPLFPAPAPRRKYPLEIKAGRLFRDGETNLVKPDDKKGLVYMDQGDDGLMHFYWKDRKTGTVELVTILAIITIRNVEFASAYYFYLPNIDMSRISSSFLGNASSSECHNENYFFWAQNAKDDKDEENLAKVNRLINDPQSALAENRQQSSGSSSMPGTFRPMDDFSSLGMDQDQLFQILQQHGAFGGLNIPATTPATEPQSSTNILPEEHLTTPASEQAGMTSEQLGSLRNILSRIQVPDLNLADILTPSAIEPLLNNPEIAAALFPEIPQNIERTPEELREVMRSPQFHQALQTLSVALQSGELGPLLSQLGLDPSAGNGVEAFLRAIQEQVQGQQGEGSERSRDNNTDQDYPETDRMDED
ncbi:10090_t:CDS:2 [Paraglomus occultum]|uniref:10090_t:CDS:1 n=1 Tax=Paraglomus occultum TaxID=144539 RepID=A0A9N8VHQ9_9GLOM|nr:10090_t:CDS:2 [Paraglomus occultum]